MATQFSDLQKLLINVAPEKCDAFIKTHINAAWEGPTETGELPEFNIAAGVDDAYYNKVVFLQKYNTIYTKGIFFGYNGDLKASFEDLVNDLKTGVTEKGITVKYDPTQNAIVTEVTPTTYSNGAWSDTDMTKVTDAQSVKNYVDHEVADAVSKAAAAMDFKGGISNAAVFELAKNNANNGDVYVVDREFTLGTGENPPLFELGDLIIFRKEGAITTYTVVETNHDGALVKGWAGVLQTDKLAVVSGDNLVKPIDYTIGDDEFADTGNSTILATEAGVMAYVTGAIDAIDDPEHTGTGDYITYTYSTTNGITSINSIDLDVAEYTVNTNALGEDSLDNTEGLVDHEALNTVIGYLEGKIDAVDCEVTTLTEVDGDDYLSVTKSQTGNDRNYTVGLKVVSLSSAVGMTYNAETGKWSAPEGSSATDGLASAADVANELVSDEKVIAAALNDHEARIDALEDFVGDINGTIQDQLVIGDVTVNGLQVEETTYGLVNTTLLARVINALDPWEDYV